MQIPFGDNILVSAKIQNLGDSFEFEKGRLAPDEVRTVGVQEALVNTDAIRLSMPRRLIEQLGLHHLRTLRARTRVGVASFGVFSPVLLTVLGRDCVVEVAEAPGDGPVVIGRVPLALLEFAVDPVRQCLTGNPEHGGEPMIDTFQLDLTR